MYAVAKCRLQSAISLFCAVRARRVRCRAGSGLHSFAAGDVVTHDAALEDGWHDIVAARTAGGLELRVDGDTVAKKPTPAGSLDLDGGGDAGPVRPLSWLRVVLFTTDPWVIDYHSSCLPAVFDRIHVGAQDAERPARRVHGRA